MTREEKVQQIMQHAKSINANITTVVFLLAMMNDKRLTKFHEEFLTKK
jgi:hypothetical protein